MIETREGSDPSHERKVPAPITAAEFTEKTPLEPGLIIEGFDGLPTIDPFIMKVAAHLLKTDLPEPVPAVQTVYFRTLGGEMKKKEVETKPAPAIHIRESNNRTDVSLAAKIRKQSRVGRLHFNGPIKEVRITFLDPATAFEYQRNAPSTPVNDDEIATFLFEGEMHSTGKGKIGTIARRVTMYVPALGDLNWAHHVVRFRSKPLNQAETKTAVESLLIQSRTQAILTPLVEGWHEVQGGAPTLGKR